MAGDRADPSQLEEFLSWKSEKKTSKKQKCMNVRYELALVYWCGKYMRYKVIGMYALFLQLFFFSSSLICREMRIASQNVGISHIIIDTFWLNHVSVYSVSPFSISSRSSAQTTGGQYKTALVLVESIASQPLICRCWAEQQRMTAFCVCMWMYGKLRICAQSTAMSTHTRTYLVHVHTPYSVRKKKTTLRRLRWEWKNAKCECEWQTRTVKIKGRKDGRKKNASIAHLTHSKEFNFFTFLFIKSNETSHFATNKN